MFETFKQKKNKKKQVVSIEIKMTANLTCSQSPKLFHPRGSEMDSSNL